MKTYVYLDQLAYGGTAKRGMRTCDSLALHNFASQSCCTLGLGQVAAEGLQNKKAAPQTSIHELMED